MDWSGSDWLCLLLCYLTPGVDWFATLRTLCSSWNSTPAGRTLFYTNPRKLDAHCQLTRPVGRYSYQEPVDYLITEMTHI